MEVSALAVQQIPITKIKANPENPRGEVDPQEVQAMAAALKEEGQKTSIKVRLLTEAEKVQYPPFEYLLIGGHVRLEGAKLAGLENLRAEVVEGSNPDQEFLDAVLDNRWSDMGWWRWDLIIERLLKPTNGKGQSKVAIQLELSPTKVSYAWKITKSLTPTAREWVSQNLLPQNSKNKGFLVTESILLILADLEEPQKVEEALKAVIDRQMTEKEAKKLVEWMKSGNSPESYKSSGKSGKGERLKDGGSGKGEQPEVPTSQIEPIGSAPRDDSGNCDMAKDPYASYWEPLPDYVNVQMEDGGYVAILHLTPTQAPIAVYGAMAWLEQIKGIVYEGTTDLRYNNAWPELIEEAKKAELVVSLSTDSTSSAQVGDEQNQASGTPHPDPLPQGARVNSTSATEGLERVVPVHEEVAESPAGNEMPKPKDGLLSQIAQAAKEKLNLTPQGIADGLLQDGKRAVNYEIRKGMRDVLKDVF